MKRGTIVLTPFPFTDLTSHKIRPAVVVSRSTRTGQDVIVAFITTFQGGVVLMPDLLIEHSHPDYHQTGLKRDSLIKLDKLVTIDTSIMLGELGELSTSLLQEVNDRLRYVLEL